MPREKRLRRSNRRAKTRFLYLSIMTLLTIFALMFMNAKAKAATSLQSSYLTISVVSDTGKEFQIYPHSSSRNLHKAYLEAVEGSPYTIRLTNKSGLRMGLAISVDGRNIISGRQAEPGRKERLYVVDPHTSASYSGWRTGEIRVRRFYFTREENLYDADFGSRPETGIISIAVYPEKRPGPFYNSTPPDPPPALGSKDSQYRQEAMNMTVSANDGTGTGYGQMEYSPSQQEPFEPGELAEVILLKYKLREVLCRQKLIDCSGFYGK